MNEIAPPARGAAATLRPALVMYLLMLLLMGIEYQFFQFAAVWLGEGDRWLWVHEIFSAAIACVVVWFVWPDPVARRLWVRPRPSSIELCVVVGIASALFLVLWEENIPGAGSYHFLHERDAGWPLWLVLITGSAAPALFEELAFRGFLLQRLRQVLDLPMAIALQAALFSLIHLDQVYLLPHWLFGAAAGVLRVAAGALWPCVLFHFVWNGWLALEQYSVL